MKRREMNKRLVIILLCMITFCTSPLNAREIRTPLPVWRFYNHYPLPRPKADDCGCWNFDVWGAGYFRNSDEAFKDFNGFDTEQLSALFFGEPSFVGIQAFVPGSVSPINPFLQFAQITPKVCYNETGAFFGINVDRVVGCSGCWHVGARANISFRNIKNELVDCCDLVAEENLSDVCVMDNENVLNAVCSPEVITQSYAYRLDFLSSLFLEANPPNERLVQYSATDVRINQVLITNGQLNPANHNPVHVIQRDDGTQPAPPFALVQTSNGACPNVLSLPDVGSDGSGAGGNNQRARFIQGTNYLPLGSNIAAQRLLWVVPTARDNGGGLELMPDAINIRTAINSITQGINTSVLDFFAAQGISFASQKTQGAGDLLLEFYANRPWACDILFSELYAGIRFPTGIRVKNPGQLLKMPTGNNGHYELYGGTMLGWQGLCWLYGKLSLLGGYVFPRKERVAAPFAGATIKNIGPTIDGKTSWAYFVGDLDFTFVPPCCQRVGFDLGVQLYVKSKDKVKFDVINFIDLIGVLQPLDANVIERRTNVIAEKVKTEAFVQGDCWELFGGFHHVFAGKNASKETDWYLGFVIYF